MSYPNIINELEIINSKILDIKSTYLPLSGGTMSGDIIGKGGYIVLNNSMETGLKSTISGDSTCIAVRNSSHNSLPSMISLISSYGNNNAVLDITAKDNRIYAKTPIDVGNNSLYFGHNGFSIRGWECPDLENGCCHWEFRADDTLARYGGVYIANEEVPAGVFSKVRTEHNSDVIVERWQNGQSWFRKWSDGWIEQGGAVSMGSGDAPRTTVSLYKNFNTTSYIVSGGIEADILRGANSDGGLYVFSRTKTNFVLSLGYAFGNSTIRWYACGY